jgi:type 1 glutamine amidotransferase
MGNYCYCPRGYNDTNQSMPRVCIVETQHPAPETLGLGLAELDGFTVRTTRAVPDLLTNAEVLVLNSIPSLPGSIPENRILRFVEGGGGVFAVHDTVFPYAANRQFIAACGIRNATAAMQIITTPGGTRIEITLARSDPTDAMTRFPIKPVPEGGRHPILDGVQEFELGEEVWAQNLAPGVRPLLMAEVGDRVFAPERFQRTPMPVAACTTRGEGRLAWFSLGHFSEMYKDPNFIHFAGNAVRWLARETNERDYDYDLFLSYSTKNRDQAAVIVAAAEGLGLRIFQDRKEITYGDIWEEEVRLALMNSREIALLASPDSMASEWVQTEWGAAWAMQRTITPILLMMPPGQPARASSAATSCDLWGSPRIFRTSQRPATVVNIYLQHGTHANAGHSVIGLVSSTPRYEISSRVGPILGGSYALRKVGSDVVALDAPGDNFRSVYQSCDVVV